MHAAASNPSICSKEAAPGSRLTVIQNLAISLMYKALAESRGNRSSEEYDAIAARLPPLKQLHFAVNEELAKFFAEREHRPEFCRFQARDQRVMYEKYPDRISLETLRKALVLHGFRVPRSGPKLSY